MVQPFEEKGAVMRKISIACAATGEEEWLATRDCFETGVLSQGPKVHEFQRAFAIRHEVKHAVAVSSGTAGLHLVLVAMGIGPGDEVIVPAFTWVSTANVVLHCGATPIFVDVDPITFNIDPHQIEEKISSRTKAVIAVHLFGQCADIDSIRSVIPDRVKVVEDATWANGATYKDRSAGALGDAAVFSFHARSAMTTGEGGMITTHDDELSELLEKLRSHGASVSNRQKCQGAHPYMMPDFNLLGYNYRMTDLQAAVGLVQLQKLDTFIAERRAWSRYYQEEFTGLDWLVTPDEPDEGYHSWQAFVCYMNPDLAPIQRNVLMDRLQEHHIDTSPGTHAIHTLPYYQKRFNLSPDLCPNAFACELNTIAFPMHNRMRAVDYHEVVTQLYQLSEVTLNV